MSNYMSILTADIANGQGFRVTIYLSGCERKCRGCFNPQSWSFDAGRPVTEETFKKIENELKKDFIKGLTLLGGEPLHPRNCETSKKLAKLAHSYGKDVWCWSRIQV